MPGSSRRTRGTSTSTGCCIGSRLEAEAEREAAARGDGDGEAALTRLVLRGTDIGLGERLLAALAPRSEQARLPWTRLAVGSPVVLSTEGGGGAWRGVISRLGDRLVEVALQRAPEEGFPPGTFQLALAADDIARQRMQRALGQVTGAQGSRTAELRAVLLGEEAGRFDSERLPAGWEAHTTHLNAAQRAAVGHALSAEDVAVIHGPPGTGKTTTVCALMAAAVSGGARILACAPSNLAVDNLAEQLLAAGVSLVRIGHPVRVLASLQAYTLDALVEQQDEYRQAKALRKEAFGLRGQADRFRRSRPAPGEKQALRREASSMLDEARLLEAQAVARVLDRAAVVLSTLTAIDSAVLGQRRFDLGVIDEAGQSTEPATWVPVPRVDRLVLAGDHQQLPPTVISTQAAREGFGVSLLERLMGHEGGRLARRLDVQYRMHAQIMTFSNREFYEDSLIAADSVATHRLVDLPGVADLPLTTAPVTYIDTAGASYDEMVGGESASRSNPQEAALAARLVGELLAAGVAADAIGVITPYSAQVALLRELLADAVEINSVDGFQGREKEAIVISLVRSNWEGQVGFLAETRRMNVALTRARRALIVIGDSGTITAEPFYLRLVAYFEEIGAYQSVWENWA